MAYKVLIVSKVTVDSKFSKLVKLNEVIRSEPFTVSLTIKNIGKNVFPGGTVKSLRVSFGVGMEGLELHAGSEYTIPVLNPEAEHTVKHTFSVIATGSGWIHVTIEAADKQSVEYYQNVGGRARSDDWVYPLYCVEREMVEILFLLKNLAKRGEKA